MVDGGDGGDGVRAALVGDAAVQFSQTINKIVFRWKALEKHFTVIVCFCLKAISFEILSIDR